MREEGGNNEKKKEKKREEVWSGASRLLIQTEQGNRSI